jgi:hypothetical protein
MVSCLPSLTSLLIYLVPYIACPLQIVCCEIFLMKNKLNPCTGTRKLKLRLGDICINMYMHPPLSMYVCVPNLQRILNGELSPLINIIINIPCTLKTLGKRRQMEY